MPSQNYLVFVRSVPGTKETPSAEQMRTIYAAFNAWQEKYKANIVDMGAKLKPGGKILTSSGVTDGPFAEAKEVIGGYMVVAADNFDGAIEIARECPGIVGPGTSVEIREIATPPNTSRISAADAPRNIGQLRNARFGCAASPKNVATSARRIYLTPCLRRGRTRLWRC